jgi:hypothetical protein
MGIDEIVASIDWHTPLTPDKMNDTLDRIKYLRECCPDTDDDDDGDDDDDYDGYDDDENDVNDDDDDNDHPGAHTKYDDDGKTDEKALSVLQPPRPRTNESRLMLADG